MFLGGFLLLIKEISGTEVDRVKLIKLGKKYIEKDEKIYSDEIAQIFSLALTFPKSLFKSSVEKEVYTFWKQNRFSNSISTELYKTFRNLLFANYSKDFLENSIYNKTASKEESVKISETANDNNQTTELFELYSQIYENYAYSHLFNLGKIIRYHAPKLAAMTSETLGPTFL